MGDPFTCKEIYPKILVYNNVFEDIDRMYEIAKLSFEQSDDEKLFENPIPWKVFGEYVDYLNVDFDRSKQELIIDNEPIITNKIQEDQYFFVKELVKAFHIVNNDYLFKNNIKINNEELEKVIVREYNQTPVSQWIVSGPSICKYNQGAGNSETKAMRYHTDYMREVMPSPGFKFVITTTSYFNDNYEGGELDFSVGGKLIKYKPKAGDIIVFPSGHPDFLSEDNEVYLHGVEKCIGTEKYFSRMYWSKYQYPTQEWNEKVNEFGLDKWEEMFKSMNKEYRSANRQREYIEGAVRINES